MTKTMNIPSATEIAKMSKAACVSYLDAAGIAPDSLTTAHGVRTAKVADLRNLVLNHVADQRNGKSAPTTMARTGVHRRGLAVNLAVLDVEEAKPKPKAKRAAAKPVETKPLTRGQQARARQVALNNHRGKGRKLTDAELTDYIRKVQAAYPESTVRAEAEYAYWVEGIATGNARFARLWEEALAAPAKPAKAAAAPRKTVTTKAPAKRATKR